MNKKGFTLIEIIIVIVILGILATLAVPRITGQMTTAKAAEAMNFLGTIKRAAQDCLTSANGAVTSCDTVAELGIVLPATRNFAYTTNGPAIGATTYGITARHIGAGTVAAPTGDYLCMKMTIDQATANAIGEITATVFSGQAAGAAAAGAGSFVAIANRANSGVAGADVCSGWATAI